MDLRVNRFFWTERPSCEHGHKEGTMPYRMEVGPVVVECDDPVEALSLARTLQEGGKPPEQAALDVGPTAQGATSE